MEEAEVRPANLVHVVQDALEVRHEDDWGGLPPPGERPIEDRRRFLLEVLGIFGLWMLMWAVFRIATVEWVIEDELVSALLSIIFAPTLTLIPPVLWWRYRLRERGIPYLLTRRNLFTSVLIACIAVVVFFVFLNLSYPLLVEGLGIQPEEDLQFIAAWRAQGLDWLVGVTFLYMFIVGPVEELFHRGFVQDQVNRSYPAYFGILLASVVFVLGHVPIDFMVYKVDLTGWAIRWISSFPFAIAMGAFYHWSRNIWGVAVYHGLYDWFLGIAYLEYGASGVEVTAGQWMVIIGVWSLAELLIITGLAYAGYRLWWKGDRPAGSLGFRVRGISSATPDTSVLKRLYDVFRSRRLVRFAGIVDRGPTSSRRTWSLAVVAVVIFGTLGFSAGLGVVPETAGGGSEGQGGGGGQGYEGDVLALDPLSERDYAPEGETVEYGYEVNQAHGYLTVNVTLEWVDEPAESPRYSNTPDRFSMEVWFDDGSEMTRILSGTESSGVIDLSWRPGEVTEGLGVFVSVTAENCGNQVPVVSPVGLRERSDDGNYFDLTVEAVVEA